VIDQIINALSKELSSPVLFILDDAHHVTDMGDRAAAHLAEPAHPAYAVTGFSIALAGFLHTLYQPIVSPNVVSLGVTVTALLIILIGSVAISSEVDDLKRLIGFFHLTDQEIWNIYEGTAVS